MLVSTLPISGIMSRKWEKVSKNIDSCSDVLDPLFGVVWIYTQSRLTIFSNVVRSTINRVVTSVIVNLPNDATHAPFHAITLPETFELDSLQLDDSDKDWCRVVSSQEQGSHCLSERL
ncbi:hypothetical protein Salat_0945800 [Sesamum alatum]|uniref:Uncharacterized protein n=1 Tax=Sesamum alatum TaxID=300844 RepID=A0AAE2CRI5_9LAMI|nr:hypothetical protein Salat_0945800 [Sesamum alatum]